MPLDALRITVPGGVQIFQSNSFASFWVFLEREIAREQEMWVTDCHGNKLQVKPCGQMLVLKKLHINAPGGISPRMQQLIDRLDGKVPTE